MASTPNEAASAPTEQARSEETRSEQAPVVNPEVPFNAPHSIAIDSFSDVRGLKCLAHCDPGFK